MEKKENVFLKAKATCRYILKHYVHSMQSLPSCCHFPSTSRSARCKKEAKFLVLHITTGSIFLHSKTITVVVGGIVIAIDEMIVSWVPRCKCAFFSFFLTKQGMKMRATLKPGNRKPETEIPNPESGIKNPQIKENSTNTQNLCSIAFACR